MQLLMKLLVILLVQIVVSICCLSRGKKKTSYVLEILVTLCAISYELSEVDFQKIPNSIIFYMLEYIVAKVLILIIVTGLRYFSFYQIVSITKNGKIAKIGYIIFGKSKFCKIVSNFRKLEYGPRLKLGIPGMAGKVHKKTGIKFDEKGFPKFKSLYTVKLNRKYYKKSREVHFYNASKILWEKAMKSQTVRRKFTKTELKYFSNGDVPPKYTWHHYQDKGVLQLVDRKIHADVNHIGGFSIWGKK